MHKPTSTAQVFHKSKTFYYYALYHIKFISEYSNDIWAMATVHINRKQSK
jgi:hypothetical protein